MTTVYQFGFDKSVGYIGIALKVSSCILRGRRMIRYLNMLTHKWWKGSTTTVEVIFCISFHTGLICSPVIYALSIIALNSSNHGWQAHEEGELDKCKINFNYSLDLIHLKVCKGVFARKTANLALS